MGKKSKRRPAIKPSAAASAKNSACTHGAPLIDASGPRSIALANARMGYLDGILHTVGVKEENNEGSLIAIMTKIMEHLDSAGLMEDHMVSFILAFAVNKVLNKRNQIDRKDLLISLTLVIAMEHWLQVGKEEFVNVVENLDPKSRRKHPWYAEWIAAYMNLATERDAVRALVRRIPCGCLDEAKAERKKDPKNKTCQHCRKLVLDSQLFVCSKCEIARYCSDKCIEAHWNTHRPFCQSFPKPKKVF